MSIAVAPATIGLVPGNSQALTVTATYDAGPTANVTSTATYASSDNGVATVSPAGLVTAVAVGLPATITATYLGQTATSVVTVTAMPTGGLVFWDDYAAGAGPLAAFTGSDTAANPVVRDTVETNNGRASLKITANGTCAGYVGGYIASATPRDLSAYNVMSFWAKAAAPGAPIHNIGFGNDNTSIGTAAFNVESHGATGSGTGLTTTWQKFYVPIPNPAAATAVNGLFYFSGGCSTFTVWVNDIQFETLTAPQLAAAVGAVTGVSGSVPATLAVQVGTPASFGDPAPHTINYTHTSVYTVGWAYYTYVPTDSTVATVDGNGMVVGHTTGTTTIAASLLGTALGTTTVTVTVPLAVPTTIATAPPLPQGSAISLFSSVYTNVPVASWSTSWSGCCNTLTDPFPIALTGHNVKKYDLHHFVGIQFFPDGTNTNLIDASTMTTFHVDVWTPNPPARLQIQLVDFPSGTAVGGVVGAFNATGLATGTWVSLDIPLTSFAGLASKGALGQILFLAQNADGSNSAAVIYVDNIYFH
jgi:hypothetical protein